MGRNRLWLIVAGAIVAVLILACLAKAFLSSPAPISSEAAPPPSAPTAVDGAAAPPPAPTEAAPNPPPTEPPGSYNAPTPSNTGSNP